MLFITYEGKEYDKPLPPLSPWEKVWLRITKGSGAVVIEKEKREEILKAFQNARKPYVETLTKKYVTDILNNNDFDPKYDIEVLRYMEDEYKEKIKTESDFKEQVNEWRLSLQTIMQKNPTLGARIIILLTFFGWGDDFLSFGDKPDKIPLATFLQNLKKDTQKTKELVQQGFPELPQLTRFDRVIGKAEQWGNMIDTIIQTTNHINAMKSPEDLAKEFIEKLKEYDKTHGIVTEEKKYAEQIAFDIKKYNEFYQQQSEKREKRKEWMNTTRDQIVRIIVDQARYESIDLSEDIEEIYNAQTIDMGQIASLSDDQLKEINTSLSQLSESIDTETANNKALIKKRTGIMTPLLQKIPLERRKDNADTLLDGRAKRQDAQKCMITGYTKKKKLIGTQQKKIQIEQKRKSYEKSFQQRTDLIAGLIEQFTEKCEELREKEVSTINKERKRLGVLLEKTTNDEEMMKIRADITNLEKKHNEGKNASWFTQKASDSIKTNYDIDSPAYFLITQGLFSCTEEERQSRPKLLATQEQAGKQLNEMTCASIDKKTSSGVFSSNSSKLTSGPEYDRIAKYRADFPSTVKKNEEGNTKSIEELIGIAKELEKNGVFALNSFNGLSVGSWCFPNGSQRHIGNGGSLFSSIDPNNNRASFGAFQNDQTLCPGTTIEPRWSAIMEDVSQRPDVIKQKIQPLLDVGIKPMHQTGNTIGASDFNSDFYNVCVALQKNYNPSLSEDDALVIMMYLQGLYGRYWVGGNRGYVFLFDINRRFGSADSDDFSASLLVSVKNHLLSPSGARASGKPLSQEEILAQEKDPRLVSFKTYHQVLRTACRNKRSTEKLPDGRNMWDASMILLQRNAVFI